MAPEFYDNLKYHTSWTKLLFRFLFDQELSLFSRILRKDRGNVPLGDESKPDAEVIDSLPSSTRCTAHPSAKHPRGGGLSPAR